MGNTNVTWSIVICEAAKGIWNIPPLLVMFSKVVTLRVNVGYWAVMQGLEQWPFLNELFWRIPEVAPLVEKYCGLVTLLNWILLRKSCAVVMKMAKFVAKSESVICRFWMVSELVVVCVEIKTLPIFETFQLVSVDWLPGRAKRENTPVFMMVKLSNSDVLELIVKAGYMLTWAVLGSILLI